MLQNINPEAEAGIVEEVTEIEEEGQRLCRRLLGRAEMGLGDEDGNAIGVACLVREIQTSWKA